MSNVIPRGRERVALGALLVLYLSMAVGFTVATPYGEAPDEDAHLLFVEHLVRYGTLPRIGPASYSVESSQPPLYYVLGALIIKVGQQLADQAGSDAYLAPRFDPNLAQHKRLPGAYAVYLHPTAQRWPIWPYVLRAFSTLLGAGLVLLTYLTARVLVPPPAPATVALTATACAALIPQANFIRASIANENLADFFAAWVLLLLALQLTRPPARGRVVLCAVVVGLGLLSKLSVAPLGLVAGGVFWLRRQSPRGRAQDLCAFAAVLGAVVGPFFLYRVITYGDPLATAAWGAMLPPDSP
ncbi:MAG TPA: glycosyltransferase family 39 protein, partial [Chloroflexia bacterium]|nr:glycosyltransferase family 39 protein [Chloroflexia bacterium]